MAEEEEFLLAGQLPSSSPLCKIKIKRTDFEWWIIPVRELSRVGRGSFGKKLPSQ